MKGDEKQRKKINFIKVMTPITYNLTGLLVNDYSANKSSCPRDFIFQKRKKCDFLIPF